VSDERLRQLERRFREARTTEAEAAWLQARLRAGAIAPERVQLAAYCDHEPAQSVLGADVPEPLYGFRAWAKGIQHWGREATLRLVVSTAQAAWENAGASSDAQADRLLPLLRTAEAAVLDPSDTTRYAVRQALAREGDRRHTAPPLHRTWQAVLVGTLHLLRADTEDWPRLRPALHEVLLHGGRTFASLGDARRELASLMALWALGYGDPVRERATTRAVG
jgi:hypothetical protein